MPSPIGIPQKSALLPPPRRNQHIEYSQRANSIVELHIAGLWPTSLSFSFDVKAMEGHVWGSHATLGTPAAGMRDCRRKGGLAVPTRKI